MLPGIGQFDLTGLSAIITGGYKGLGQAMAAGLASAGAEVLITSRHEDEAVAAAERIATDFRHKALGVQADVTDEQAVSAMVERAIAEFGKIVILINNAVINVRGPIDGLTLEQFKEVHDVNVDWLWLCSRAVVPHMKERRSGRIINLASTPGLVGLADRTPYVSSKGAVVQMARALGRWGTLAEIQGAAIFLAIDAAGYMTDSMVTVDGGWTAH